MDKEETDEMELSALHDPGVLVVDDDRDILEAMAHMLTARGFRVLTASNQDDALAILHDNPGRVDALIADLSMPGDRTGNLARTIAANYPHIGVLYATGIPRHMALAQGMVQPDAPYLQKPVEADVLAGMLRSMLSKRVG